ncbi:DMT family transporter [Halosimplex amylolyticum]|uniref:DMT family transporter n=1 Tax=Halosimplex amylolyticum TaxID=3396616 RepID=UPI003F54E187
MTGLRRYAFALGPLTAAGLWGGMYVVSKWGFSVIPPVTLGFLRVALGGAALLAVLRAGNARSSAATDGGSGVARGDWPGFVALGGWVTLTIATQFLGTDLTNASQGSLLTVLTPVFTVGLGAAVLGERVTRTKALGIALAGVGTVVVLAGQYDLGGIAAGNALGVALLLVASVAWAGFTVWGAPLVRRYSALTAATYSTLASVPMLGVLSVVELAALGYGLGDVPLDGPTLLGSGPTLLAVAYLGLASTAAAWYLWYTGLAYVSAGTVAVFFFAQPVVGAALGAVFLDEHLGPGFAAGGALMAAGVWAVSRERAERADEA